MFFHDFYDTYNERYILIKNTDIVSIREYTDTHNYKVTYNTAIGKPLIFENSFNTNADSIKRFLDRQDRYKEKENG